MIDATFLAARLTELEQQEKETVRQAELQLAAIRGGIDTVRRLLDDVGRLAGPPEQLLEPVSMIGSLPDDT